MFHNLSLCLIFGWTLHLGGQPHIQVKWAVISLIMSHMTWNECFKYLEYTLIFKCCEHSQHYMWLICGNMSVPHIKDFISFVIWVLIRTWSEWYCEMSAHFTGLVWDFVIWGNSLKFVNLWELRDMSAHSTVFESLEVKWARLWPR